MIIRTRSVYKQFTWEAPGGVTDSCFWDDEEAAKGAIHYIVNNADDLLRRWHNANHRKRNREKRQYRYLHDPGFLKMCRLRAKRLNHTLRPYWEWLCDRLGNRCQICGERFEFYDLEVDHILPLSGGGKNTWDNIQPLCAACNLRKMVSIVDPSLEILEAQQVALACGIVQGEKKHERKVLATATRQG